MGITPQQQRFVEEYTTDFNATQAAIRAGYSERTARQQGSRLLTKVDISEAIADRIKEKTLTADRLLMMQSEIAQLDLSNYVHGGGINISQLIIDGHGKHIKSIKYTRDGTPVYEFYDKQRAQEKLLSVLEPQLGSEEKPFQINVIRVNRDNSD